MSRDPKAELANALTIGGPAAAMHVLRHAISWSAATLAGLTQPGAAAGLPGSLDEAAIECVIALDDALEEVEKLAAPIADLVEIAVTGTPVADHLRQQMNALTALADRVAVARREREALSHVEQQLRADAAEHERLTATMEELHRYERLAEALPELRAQQESLSTRMDAMLAPAQEAEQALVETAEEVLSLSKERLADVSDKTRAVLAEIDSTERSWAGEVREHEKLKATLAGNVRRYEELKQERVEQVAALQTYCDVDTALMRSLPGGDTDVPNGQVLRSALESVSQTLRDVDDGLRAALARHDALLSQSRRLIGWNEPVLESSRGGTP